VRLRAADAASSLGRARRSECRTRVLQSHPMEAATWTAIGLLAATSLGSLLYLGSRIDALGTRMDALGGRLDARIDVLGADLGSRIEAQGIALNARIDNLNATLNTQGAALNARIDALSATMDEHMGRHAG